MAPEIPALKKLTEPHARQDRVRLTLCIHRKPGTSVEEFQRYWREEHSQLFAGIAVVKSNLLTYEQVGGSLYNIFESLLSDLRSDRWC